MGAERADFESQTEEANRRRSRSKYFGPIVHYLPRYDWEVVIGSNRISDHQIIELFRDDQIRQSGCF